MSNYVVKVFEKHENGDLTPFAFNEEGTLFELHGEGFMLFALTETESEDGRSQLRNESAIHDLSEHMIAEALNNNKICKSAMAKASLFALLNKLTGDLDEAIDNAAE